MLDEQNGHATINQKALIAVHTNAEVEQSCGVESDFGEDETKNRLQPSNDIVSVSTWNEC